MISKIYSSNKILFKSGSRKGKSRNELALMVQMRKDKKHRNPKFIKFLKDEIRREKKWRK